MTTCGGSCGHLTGRRVEAPPQALLQRGRTYELGIRGLEAVVMSEDARTLPREFHGVDEDESGRRWSRVCVAADGIGGQAGDIGPGRRVERQRGRRVEVGRSGG